MNIEQEIRAQIEKNKGLKLAVGEINNHLSILEGLLRNERDDVQKQVNEAYQRGLHEGNDIGYKDGVNDGRNDAWEAAKKVVLNPDEGGLSILELNEIFNCATIQQVFRKYTLSEVIAKLKAYEEKKKADDKIKVRDEVVWKQDGNVVMVVTRVYMVEGFEWCDGICRDGKVYQILTENARKTGRHFDIILEEKRE